MVDISEELLWHNTIAGRYWSLRRRQNNFVEKICSLIAPMGPASLHWNSLMGGEQDDPRPSQQ